MNPLQIPRKIIAQLRLLRDDPERFATNLVSVFKPAVFEQRMINILEPPPLHASVSPSSSGPPVLNILIPILDPGGLTGGPNTALVLAYHLARAGVPIRIAATITPSVIDAEGFWTLLAKLVGATDRPAGIELTLDYGPAHPLRVGAEDWFLATHWMTAHQLRPLLPQMKQHRFLYLIQDFEPGFYQFSSNYAYAALTYDMDYIAIFNEHLLRDYFIEQRVGRFADPDFAACSFAFEPAVDRALFHPEPRADRPKRRLLFYARPTVHRNLFGIGLIALRKAVAAPVFRDAPWEFVGIGGAGKMPAIALGGGHVLQVGPWLDHGGYAAFLRGSDVLLSLMLSPHTSYPVLEMAACGGQVVTNSFGAKTNARLQEMAPGVLVVRPDPDEIAAAIITAATQAQSADSASQPTARMPPDWGTAFADVVTALLPNFRATP